MQTVHVPVLLKEVIDGLDLQDGDFVVDGTLGGGGHSFEICQKISPSGRIVALDVDESAISRGKARLRGMQCRIDYILENFRNIDRVLDSLGVERVSKILVDLGFSSDQMDLSGRGFTFSKNEPLVMTLSSNKDGDALNAFEIVNSWDESSIADIIYGYGGEQFSKRIAKGIVQARNLKPIKTTFDLVEIIEKSVPGFYKRKKIHCATKTFQALRIAVNDEIGALKDFLPKAWDKLAKGGRLAVISFHELEDRHVKNFFKDKKETGVGLLVNKKPISPDKEELAKNPRSRSAKLRIIIKRI